MRSLKQRELDRAEEYVLTALFGDINRPVLSPKVQLFLVAKNINFDDFINEKIAIFEEFSKDFMNDEGFYIGEKISKVIAIKYPQLNGLNIPDIKPIDLFKMLNNLIGLENIGQAIQTL